MATLKPQAGAATPMMMNATPSHTPAPQTPVRTGGETAAAGQMADDSNEETGSQLFYFIFFKVYLLIKKIKLFLRDNSCDVKESILF